MRLIIKFESLSNISYDAIGKYDILGFIYNVLNETDLRIYHSIKGFKFFTFSNIFPVSEFKKGTTKTLIISSANDTFINVMADYLNNIGEIRLNKFIFNLIKVNTIKTKVTSKIITGTPICLFEDNIKNKYYSFNSHPDFNFFFERLKDNSLKKFNAFYNTDFNLDDNLFSNFSFKREVAIRLNKKGNKFIIIGSLWNSLEFNLNKNNRDFYQFLFDVGFGEKNSLGFGFVNKK